MDYVIHVLKLSYSEISLLRILRETPLFSFTLRKDVMSQTARHDAQTLRVGWECRTAGPRTQGHTYLVKESANALYFTPQIPFNGQSNLKILSCKTLVVLVEGNYYP